MSVVNHQASGPVVCCATQETIERSLNDLMKKCPAAFGNLIDMPSPYSKRNEERLLAWLVHSALRERAMARLGFHASHEQFPPSELLALVRATEMAGFDCAMSIGPLSPVGICSGPVGVCVVLAGSGPSGNIAALWVISAPGYRYHPAIIAQGAATLAEMFPGRFLLWAGKRSAAERGYHGIAVAGESREECPAF
jgi:hypothetical protein